MTSVDEIFRKSGLSGKRKLDPVRDPNEIYKSAKLSSNGPSSRHARVDDDAADENGDTSDVEAGPAPPPDGDSDTEAGPALPPPDEDDAGDDEDGRFFGGGITAAEAQVIDYVDAADASSTTAGGSGGAEVVNAAWLRKTALAFEKRISRNAALRARHEAEPARFIDSEAELDADVRKLGILGEHAGLYREFAALGCVASLVGLLAHENTDIAISAIQVVGELTDEDVAVDDERDMQALLDALIEADFLGLLVSNLERLDEGDEADRNGVYYSLGVVENMCSNAQTAEKVPRNEGLVKWLLQRVQKKEKPVSQNKQYAAEILAIMASTSPAKLAAMDAVDIMLQLVAAYRKLDPEKNSDESEYMEDLFEALTSIVDEPEGKAKFLEAEGIELCLIMLKEGKKSKAPALRLLDHAISGAGATETCQKLVEAGGLKTLFTTFMKSSDMTLTQMILSILWWMLRLLPADSAERIRLLAKFVEKAYEKTARLLEIRDFFDGRLKAADAEIEAKIAKQIKQDYDLSRGEAEEMFAEDHFFAKIEAGLATLQQIDVILAWLIAEDGGERTKIGALLADRGQDLMSLQKTIQERVDRLDLKTPDAKETRDMLKTLMQFLV